MNTLTHPLLANIFNSGPALIAIAGIAGGVVLTSIIIIHGLKFVQRRQELWHETARIALEKGQPLPPMPDDMRRRKDDEEGNHDLRSGLIMVASGAALYLFFASFMGPRMASIGLIPGFIGVALLLHAALNALFGRKKNGSAPTDRPSQT